ncbi:MAG: hypothetical protein WBD90_06455, partial [Xanthobacteraceae bacterium]
ADAIKPGARAVLEQKAQKLTGAADSAAPPAGRAVYGWHIAEGGPTFFWPIARRRQKQKGNILTSRLSSFRRNLR